jgi:hypothetical protein
MASGSDSRAGDSAAIVSGRRCRHFADAGILCGLTRYLARWKLLGADEEDVGEGR